LEGTACGLIKVVFQYLHGWTEENFEKSYIRIASVWLRFEANTSSL
jgi:hypothetical protein